MSHTAPVITRLPADVVRQTPVSQASNGICYAVAGEVTVSNTDLERMVAAVPASAAAALERKAYYFVPLTVNQGDETVIADRYDVALSDNAVCHRNLNLGDSQCVFISTRLMDDKFSVAFEFYINVGHAVVERAGVSQAFADLAWKQVKGMRRVRLRSMPGSPANWLLLQARTLRNIRTIILRPRFPIRFQFICCRCFWMWTTTICGSAIIRCWLRRPWLSGCGKLRSCFRRIRDLSSRFITRGGDSFPRLFYCHFEYGYFDFCRFATNFSVANVPTSRVKLIWSPSIVPLYLMVMACP